MSVEPPLGRTARVLGRAVRLRCPRCGETPLFRGWFSMRPECLVCGLVFERAQGADLSLTVQFSVWVPFVVLFPLWFFRYSRSAWLALEYVVNPRH